MFFGSTMMKVDPVSCVTYTKICPISSSGFHRLMSSFMGGDGNDGSFFGIEMVGNFALVVKLNYSNPHVVRTLLVDNGKTKEEQNVQLKTEMFGIGSKIGFGRIYLRES